MLLSNIDSLFKELSHNNDICYNYYNYWKNKDITLEQSLVFAINDVREYCSNLIGIVPIKEVGVLLEYLYYIETLENDLIWKLNYLVDYSTKLIDITMYYYSRRPISVIISKDMLTTISTTKSIEDFT